MPDIKAKTVPKKPSSPREVRVFAQTLWLWKTAKNILTPPGWPYPQAPPQGSAQNDSTETETHKQAAKRWS